MYTQTTYPLWENIKDSPTITAYLPTEKKHDCAIVILPGGAYYFRAEHEGKGYAEFFVKKGIPAFVVDYRCYKDKFPLPLQDARRAIRFVRFHASKFSISADKIAIMGSSAGGHLAALCCTYEEDITCDLSDKIDETSFLPNAQILCYPVINLYEEGITHADSGKNLLGDRYVDLAMALSPDLIATSNTPRAFIWHTFDDSIVNVINSIDYARRLRQCGVSTELHIFPHGHHGLGLCKDDDPISEYVSKWTDLLLDWLHLNSFLT